MTPTWETADHTVKLYLGKCEDVLRTFPDESRLTLVIQLRAIIDPSQPILKATPIDGYGNQYKQVRIETPHPVWRGAELRRDHFTVVQTGEVYA